MNCLREYIVYQLLCLVFVAFATTACNSNAARQEDVLGDNEKTVERENELFHQQIALVYGDSLHVRVLSWGAEEAGNYLVLMADSVHQHYVGNSFYRDGILKEAWVTDLDGDGQPEVSVFVQGTGPHQYGKFVVHELKQDFSISSVGLPQFSETVGAAYGGHDSLYINEGMIVRVFPLRNLADTTAATKYRRVKYAYENNMLEVATSEDIGKE